MTPRECWEAPSVPIAGGTDRFPVRHIYCVGRNYAEHAKEMGGDASKEPPFFFTKPADAVVPVVPPAVGRVAYPLATKNFHHEIELVVAIGGVRRQARARGCAPHCVWGYAVGLDMTRRDLQNDMREKKRPWDIGKSFAQAAPIGPIHPVRVGRAARARQDLARRQRQAPARGRSRGHDLGRAAHASRSCRSTTSSCPAISCSPGRLRAWGPSWRAIVSTAVSTASGRSRSPSTLRSPEVARWPPSSRPKKSSAATTIAPRFRIIRAGSRTTPRRRRRRARRSRRRWTFATDRGRRRRSISSCPRDAPEGRSCSGTAATGGRSTRAIFRSSRCLSWRRATPSPS